MKEKKLYWVDFQASIKVEAENSIEAGELASRIFDSMNSGPQFDSDHCLNFIEIDNIEEVEE